MIVCFGRERGGGRGGGASVAQSPEQRLSPLKLFFRFSSMRQNIFANCRALFRFSSSGKVDRLVGD